MKDLKEKRITITFFLTAFIFIIQAIDVFFIKSDNTIFGDTVIARVLGLFAVLAASKMLKFNIGRRCLGRFGWFFELIYGIGFSLAPIVLIYAAELIYFKIKGFYSDISIFILPPNSTEKGLIPAIAAYAFALIVNVVFKELYRGFMLNRLCKKLGEKKSNYVQSIIFTALSFLPAIGAFAEGGFKNMPKADVVITISASAAAVFVSSIRWGYYYKVNGSVWMEIADHFVNAFIMTCIYLSPDRLPDKWLLVKSLVIQLISCVIFIPFYYRRDRVNAEYEKEMKTRHDVLSALNESETELDEKKASNNYLMMMNETEQAKRFGGIKENEILDFDREPKAFSKGVAEIYSEPRRENRAKTEQKQSPDGKRHRRSRSTENVPKNAESISKLVDEYFKKQFDKSTYN